MNATRRQMAADLRFNGFSGQEAYEATKRVKKQWAHIQWLKGGMVVPGRPNHRPRRPKDGGLSWVGKYLQNQMKKAFDANVEAAKIAREKYEQRKRIAREVKASRA